MAWQHMNNKQNTDKNAFARVGLRYDSRSNNITGAKHVLSLRSATPECVKPRTRISIFSSNGSTNSNSSAGGVRQSAAVVGLLDQVHSDDSGSRGRAKTAKLQTVSVLERIYSQASQKQAKFIDGIMGRDERAMDGFKARNYRLLTDFIRLGQILTSGIR